MPTLQQACTILAVSRPTLRKFMEKLGIEPVQNELDGRFYELTEEQVETIRETLARRPGLQAVHSGGRLPGHITQAPRAARPESQRSASQEANLTPGLPEGCVSVYEFSRLADVNVGTVKSAIQAGRLPVTRGRWKVGNHIYEMVLTPEQQEAALRLWGKPS